MLLYFTKQVYRRRIVKNIGNKNYPQIPPQTCVSMMHEDLQIASATFLVRVSLGIASKQNPWPSSAPFSRGKARILWILVKMTINSAMGAFP